MRVLIVAPKMSIYGGAEILVVRLANCLSRIGIKNAVLTTDILPEIERDLIDTPIFNYSFKKMTGILKFLNLFKMIYSLNKGIREHRKNFDVINVHNYPAEFAIFPYRTPCVWMCNEPPMVEIGFLQTPKGTLKHLVLEVILALDRHVVQRYVKNAVVADEFNLNRFLGIYCFKPAIIHYGIDHDFFAEGGTRPGSEIQREFRVLHVGMLSPLKNQLASVQTIERLRDSIPNVKLILAGFGEGDYLATIKKYVAEMNLEEHVLFTGHVSRSQLRDFYHSCDVLLHPIRSQGGWLSPFEAVCANLPIVVSEEMTAAALVREYDLGIVTNDFAGALLEIHGNRDEHKGMAERRARWVRDNLSWDRFSEKLVESFAAALEAAAAVR